MKFLWIARIGSAGNEQVYSLTKEFANRGVTLDIDIDWYVSGKYSLLIYQTIET